MNTRIFGPRQPIVSVAPPNTAAGAGKWSPPTGVFGALLDGALASVLGAGCAVASAVLAGSPSAPPSPAPAIVARAEDQPHLVPGQIVQSAQARPAQAARPQVPLRYGPTSAEPPTPFPEPGQAFARSGPLRTNFGPAAPPPVRVASAELPGALPPAGQVIAPPRAGHASPVTLPPILVAALALPVPEPGQALATAGPLRTARPPRPVTFVPAEGPTLDAGGAIGGPRVVVPSPQKPRVLVAAAESPPALPTDGRAVAARAAFRPPRPPGASIAGAEPPGTLPPLGHAFGRPARPSPIPHPPAATVSAEPPGAMPQPGQIVQARQAAPAQQPPLPPRWPPSGADLPGGQPEPGRALATCGARHTNFGPAVPPRPRVVWAEPPGSLPLTGLALTPAAAGFAPAPPLPARLATVAIGQPPEVLPPPGLAIQARQAAPRPPRPPVPVLAASVLPEGMPWPGRMAASVGPLAAIRVPPRPAVTVAEPLPTPHPGLALARVPVGRGAAAPPAVRVWREDWAPPEPGRSLGTRGPTSLAVLRPLARIAVPAEGMPPPGAALATCGMRQVAYRPPPPRWAQQEAPDARAIQILPVVVLHGPALPALRGVSLALVAQMPSLPAALLDAMQVVVLRGPVWTRLQPQFVPGNVLVWHGRDPGRRFAANDPGRHWKARDPGRTWKSTND